eukprot:TRINITY_DN1526_c0_g1::TRINITY_DN1526_c0_g1_i1::g.28192::m.28192 TRINITY_DN1526_c0_g1::TRINITY_DN1526_c0_g1_i1::g.28192  ORF type:complete len:222 (+),score=60.21,sp/Q94HF1/EIF3K_ORYSJ/35.40/7e-44,PCI_Csn8/PF10075.4/2.4e-19,SAC3_GANP/PF03399.11/5.1e-16 TRINITY_DN1526_c0_g1_i1:37-666(+)
MDSQKVAELLATNRYDVAILPTMEAYVKQQCKDKAYDFEANLALLKLYQFDPQNLNTDILNKVLLKALMNLPSTDFQCCMYLIPEKLWNAQIVLLASLLETGKYKQFWEEAAKIRKTLDEVSGFDEAIRTFMTGTLQLTYQRVNKNTLKELLHVNDKELALIAKDLNWQDASDGKVSFPLTESNEAKPKKVVESLQFSQMTKILATLDQ